MFYTAQIVLKTYCIIEHARSVKHSTVQTCFQILNVKGGNYVPIKIKAG